MLQKGVLKFVESVFLLAGVKEIGRVGIDKLGTGEAVGVKPGYAVGVDEIVPGDLAAAIDGSGEGGHPRQFWRCYSPGDRCSGARLLGNLICSKAQRYYSPKRLSVAFFYFIFRGEHMEKSVLLNARITRQHEKRLQELARLVGMNNSAVIRLLIENSELRLPPMLSATIEPQKQNTSVVIDRPHAGVMEPAQ